MKLKKPFNQKEHESFLRQKALRYYSFSGGVPMCHCCGETIEEFLTFDHAGKKSEYEHSQVWMSSIRLVRWLLKCHRAGIKVACFNCNLGREKCGGICPHKKGVK